MHGSPMVASASVSCCCLSRGKVARAEHSKSGRGNGAQAMHNMRRSRWRQGSIAPSKTGLSRKRQQWLEAGFGRSSTTPIGEHGGEHRLVATTAEWAMVGQLQKKALCVTWLAASQLTLRHGGCRKTKTPAQAHFKLQAATALGR